MSRGSQTTLGYLREMALEDEDERDRRREAEEDAMFHFEFGDDDAHFAKIEAWARKHAVL
jgi:hypothetical protein